MLAADGEAIRMQLPLTPYRTSPPRVSPASNTAALNRETLKRETIVARRSALHAVLAIARPRQWLKNLLVVAAAGAAGALGHDDVPGRVALATLAFCMLASGLYAINDVRDAAEDRLHPRKRHRPVAAGELSGLVAALTGAGSILAGVLLCAAISPLLAAVGFGYVALTLAYTTVFRYVPVLDIVAIAGGFVLRAVAGGVSAPVTLSSWFLLVVTFAALLLAAGKRHAELTRAVRQRAPRRRVLAIYSERSLRAIMFGAATGAIISYVAWTLELPLVHGFPWRPLTIVPFVAAIGLYGRRVAAGDGEAPEELLLGGDLWLAMAAVAWLVLFALGVNAAS